jgi:glycosyltransferase involved in cell wall biosynthesis
LIGKIKDNEPLVSIIIPTFNEEKDIKNTLKKLLKLIYINKEIIVVDDSTDMTPIIVKDFEQFGVRLLHREVNEGGRCGARNVGILISKGEILIILNADVLLPKDFIEKILPHYNDGADYVLVESEVANQDKLFGRYVDARYHYIYDNQDWIEWTEGFSCRRDAAIKAGLFPISPVPLVAGEDGYLGEQLNKKGFKKVIDRSIKVHPIVSDDLQGFWKCRKEKRSVLPLYFLYKKKSFFYLLLKEFAFTVYSFLYIFLIFPLLISVFRLQKFSPRKLKDFFPFIYCTILERFAVISGGWSSIYTLFRYLLKKDKISNVIG